MIAIGASESACAAVRGFLRAPRPRAPLLFVSCCRTTYLSMPSLDAHAHAQVESPPLGGEPACAFEDLYDARLGVRAPCRKTP